MNRRAAISLVLLLACSASAQVPVPLGSVLVSRNINEADNTSPGYFNHMAVCVTGNSVVESQAGYGVLRTPIDSFMARPYSRIIIFQPAYAEDGLRAARRAERLVGLDHAPLSSMFPLHGPIRLALGINCVSVVESSYQIGNINLPDGMFVPRRAFMPPRTIR